MRWLKSPDHHLNAGLLARGMKAAIIAMNPKTFPTSFDGTHLVNWDLATEYRQTENRTNIWNP